MGIGLMKTCELRWVMINQARRTVGARSGELARRPGDRMSSNRKNGFVVWTAYTCILLIGGLSACSHAERRGKEPVLRTTQTKESPDLSDLGELKRQIKVFASYGGQQGDAARKGLEAYPSEKLIADIEVLRAQAGDDEHFKMESAFALCFFGHDCENNKRKIAEALRASHMDHRFDSVLAERMITRLIRRGDSGLLSELFNAVAWSDGALSEGLVDTFVEVLVNNPNGFLLALSGASPETRRSVYGLTDGSSLPPDDLIKVRKSLSSAGVPSSLRPIARELLASLRSNKQSA